MNKICLYVSILLVFAACGNNQKTTSNVNEDSIADPTSNVTSPKQLCFQHVSGSSNQDTSFIQLTLNAEQVSGTFNHLPYQKDSRKGTILGDLKGNIIKANWYFMQEGMKDTLPVEFKLSENELFQKTFGLDTHTGRQILTDSSTFTIRYKKIACK